MSDQTENPSKTDAGPVATTPVSGRRRFLQGGLGAAPVVMTLVSRPVLAQTCTTPSGYVSISASTAGRGVACTGRTPGYWKQTQHFGSWVGYYPTTTSGHTATYFNAVFSPPFPNQALPGPTLLEVLEMGGGTTISVARHLVAALLNAAAGWTPVLTTTVVKDMWSEYITKGSFSPTAGSSWSPAELTDYLLKTMPS